MSKKQKKTEPLFEDFSDFSFNEKDVPIKSNFQKELSTSKKVELESEVSSDIKSLKITKNISDDLDKVYEQKIARKWSLLDQWTDKSMYLEVQHVKSELFNLTAKNRLSLYDLLLQSRLKQTKEKYESALKCIKAYYRRNLASYIMSQMEELSEEIKGYQFRFLEMMKRKYKYAETLKDYPSMQYRYKSSLIEQEERYLKFLDQLIIKFEGSVSEELTDYNFPQH